MSPASPASRAPRRGHAARDGRPAPAPRATLAPGAAAASRVMRAGPSVATLLLAALLALAPALRAQDGAAALARVFADWDGPDRPGCAVAVTYDGQILFEAGFGLADLEQGTPNTPGTIFRIGSTSKQFTAACIGLLALRGELDLDAPVGTWIDELPAFDVQPTLRQMVHHTSGLPDYVELHLADGVELADHVTAADTLERLGRVQQLDFEPGHGWAYSNTNYFLLGEIVRRVSGRSLRAFAHDELFAPLGMTATHYQDRHDELVPGRANGYSRDPGGPWSKHNTTWEQVGDGGVFTSVRDLVRWERFWLDPSLLPEGPALAELMLEPVALEQPGVPAYAFGLMLEPFDGLPAVSHAGGWVGFTAEMLRLPEQKLAVIVLANSSEAQPPQLARRVARLLLGGAPPDDAAHTTPPVDGGTTAAPVVLHGADDDPDLRAALESHLRAGMARVEAFFGRPFPEPVRVDVHASRAAFTASFPREWGLDQTECWMVAYGVADALSLLSPRAWAGEACEHDGDDPTHVAEILAHELTHVFHGQLNPTRDFTGAEELGWLAEGLGVLVSGQLDHEHRSAAREALAAGAGPSALASAWSGRWRYGVCGSLARHVDERLGRDGLLALLPLTSNAQVLAALNTDEATLLADWAAAVQAGDG